MNPPLGILLGAGFGLVVGTTVAGATTVVGFVNRYYRDCRLSRGVVVAVGLSLAGVFALLIETLTPGLQVTLLAGPRSLTTRRAVAIAGENAPFLGAFGSVTALLGLYGHSLGDRIAGEIPAAEHGSAHSRRVLSPETVASADGDGQVSIDVAGDRAGAKSGPSLSPATWDAIESQTWEFPADLPVDELESRLAARIRTAIGVAVEGVSIDERGRATVTAGPPSKSVANQLSDGKRALTVETLVPAGLEAGDPVTLAVEEGSADGRVLAVHSDRKRNADQPHCGPQTDGSELPPPQQVETAKPGMTRPNRTTVAGNRRVTVAVEAEAISTVLGAEPVTLFVNSSGENSARGALRQFQRCGLVLRHGRTDEGNYDLLAEHAADVTILASRPPETSDDGVDGWQFQSGERSASPGNRHEPTSRSNLDTDSPDDPADARGKGVDLTGAENAPPPGTELFVIGPAEIVSRFDDPEPRSKPTEEV